MKIDRHNYEEFFLLYIDNELNVDQKKQVEAFVLANPDLEEEFIMLQQSKLVADPSLVFEGKESLMKEETAINMSNYEEWLLLYTDNELTTEQKILVEEFAAAHPHVKEELDLFLQTRLESQEIVFEDKASLYRREEKITVVKMSWWRVAAAAILILAAGVGTYTVINNNKTSSGTDLASGKTPSTKSNQQEQKITEPVIPQSQADINQEPNRAVAIKEDQRKIKNKKEVIIPKENLIDNQAMAKNDEQKTGANESTSVETPQLRTIQSDPGAFIAANGDKQKQIVNNYDVTKDPSQTPNLKLVSDQNDQIVYNEPEKENKKLRGFFRRATRFIEKTTKMNPANDDNKVLIGSMAVSLK